MASRRALSASAIVLAGCNALVGLDPGEPRGAGGATSSSTATHGAHVASSSAGGAAGASIAAASSGAGASATSSGSMSCMSAASCTAPPPSTCLTALCDNGTCTTIASPLGTLCEPGKLCDAAGKCSASPCGDGMLDGFETAVDCGGPECDGEGRPCTTGQPCGVDGDCDQHWCHSGLCKAPSCSDGIKNGLETDIDCGGPFCDLQGALCATLKSCAADADCASAMCAGGTCK